MSYVSSMVERKITTGNNATLIPLDGTLFMGGVAYSFTRSVMEQEGYEASAIVCQPGSLPEVLRGLNAAGARTAVATLLREGNIWNVEGMKNMGLVRNFEANGNEAESSGPSCVPVALHRLGFTVPIENRVTYARNYQASGNRYGGHVIAISPHEGLWKVEDQFGKGLIDDEAVRKLAEFRFQNDTGTNQGYSFLPKMSK